ncbi:hypothetical protein BH18ACT7_BH18ACT7_18620 [soil metagenome]
MWPFDQIDRLENATGLDAVAERIKPVLETLLADQRVTDFLHGVWLGHPLHPVLVQVPVGAWTSAAVLDAVPGQQRAAGLLIGVGLAGAVPAVAAGWADWSQQDTQQQRTGLAHAAANVVASGLYVGSLVARARGRHGLGRSLAYAGYALAGAAATVGGHLAYRQAAGPSHAVPHAESAPPGWSDIGPVEELPDGSPTLRRVEEVELFVLRRGTDVAVMIDRCSHASGPLHEGSLSTVNGEQCVTCPWHGSVFRVRDGAVVHGPATAPQPAFEVRVEDGRLQVRLPGLSMG